MKYATRNIHLSLVLGLTLVAACPIASLRADEMETPPEETPTTEVAPVPEETTPTVETPAETPAQPTIDSATWFTLFKKGVPDDIATAINGGADVNARDAQNHTALMLASMNGRTDLVQLMLDGGASPNLQDNEGRTALHLILAATPAPAAAPPKKKKGLFGDALDSVLGNVLGNVTSSLGGNVLNKAGLAQLTHIPDANLMNGLSSDLLTGLLPASLGSSLSSQYLPSLLSGTPVELTGAAPWMGVVGSALEGNPSVASIFNKPIGAGEWVSLLSAAKTSNPQIISALANANVPDAQKAQWGQFVQLAANGDKKGVAQMLKDPSFSAVAESAQTGLGDAISYLPGRDGGTGIATLLLQHGADQRIVDNSGKNPLQRALDLKMEALAAVLAKGISTPAPPVQ